MFLEAVLYLFIAYAMETWCVFFSSSLRVDRTTYSVLLKVNMNTIDSVEGERINIRGAILERSRNFLLVLAEDSPFGLDKFKWRLDKGANAVNFERCMRGLKLMTSPDPAGTLVLKP